MAALAAATGITLDTLQITQIDFRWWTLITFVVFCGFVVWIIVDLNNKNRELESKKPSILVSPELNINNDWCLRVTNEGEIGNFEAQIAILAVRLNDNWLPTEEFSAWKGVWESTNTNEVEIKTNHYDIVKLIHVRDGRHGPTLELLAYDLKTKSRIVVTGFSSDSSSETVARMMVVISSKPSPKNGTFKRIYEITPFDMVEVKPSKFGKL